jgi:carboxyl-terminal processing protease
MEKVISGGIQGTLERAHPLNSYLSPEELRLPDPGPADPGLMLRKSQIYAQVIAVSPNGPAAKAGVQVGDVVRKLDGQSIGTMSAWALERRLRGPEGSELSLLWYDNSTGRTSKISLKREKPTRGAIGVRKDSRATVLTLSDLGVGRAAELKSLLGTLDANLPLILDLRSCAGGDLAEASKVAGLFLGKAPFITYQEAGRADRAMDCLGEKEPGIARVASLSGFGTVGPAEALAAAFKKQSLPTFGERSSGMGVERSRFPLRQGGAAEIVNKRWLGAGGEKLDRQGLVPENLLRGLKPDEDPLPRILEMLNKKPEPKPEAKAQLRAGKLGLEFRSQRIEPQGRDFV